ncbi:MAG: hypothetical protein OEU09_10670 [Rhodospirillales bacterium]|nr:hypothetical protein [Rhodospirillales bacterium]MDH3911753.1 hypothetical protein [Rhodospirillales bacterium]MDH3918791.1 hypothetical protein [Rhodospirillales bacterium]MDH3966464.1 hypothetical protein [Rhodospirillales bacterium]
MKWLLDQIYGANAMGDPYYEFFVDASALIPWWYPTLVFGIAALMVTARWHARTQYRRKAALAAVRVRKRTLRRIS